MKKTYQEILEVLKEKISKVDEFAFEGFGGDKKYPEAKYNTPEYQIYISPELGEEIEIEQVGGEGEGSHWHSVKYFKDHDVYIKVTGYYSSYNGTDFDEGWDCCSEVRPEQKTITVYQ